MSEYLSQLEAIWGEDAIDIFILKFGILAYPIIQESCGRFNYPLAVIAKGEQEINDFFREISCYGCHKMIPLGLPKKEFEHQMMAAEYEVMPVYCNITSQQSYDNLLRLSNAMLCGEVNGHPFKVLPVVAFIGGIPVEYAKLLSGKIVIDGQRKINEYADDGTIIEKFIRSMIENMSTIQHELINIHSDEECMFLCGTEAILNIVISKIVEITERSQLVKKIEEGVGRLKLQWDVETDFTVIIKYFRKMLMKRGAELQGTLDRKHVLSKDIPNIEKYILYDDSFYSIAPDFFNSICDEIPYVGKSELKKALSDAGILVGEGRGRSYYTVKVRVITECGIHDVGRRIRISRQWLDLPGELTWREQIEEEVRRGRRNSHPVAVIPTAVVPAVCSGKLRETKKIIRRKGDV